MCGYVSAGEAGAKSQRVVVPKIAGTQTAQQVAFGTRSRSRPLGACIEPVMCPQPMSALQSKSLSEVSSSVHHCPVNN